MTTPEITPERLAELDALADDIIARTTLGLEADRE